VSARNELQAFDARHSCGRRHEFGMAVLPFAMTAMFPPMAAFWMHAGTDWARNEKRVCAPAK
jgi:hypothetical protein